MWKVGTLVHLKNDENSWSTTKDTLVVQGYDEKWIHCSRKGESNETRPYHINEIEKLSWNPFVRIKRMFCRAFECSYK